MMKYNSSIKSVAIGLPETYYTNDMPPFSEIPNLPKNWWRNWGMEGRYMVNKEKGESCSQLARKASLGAIEKAGLSTQDIDLIIGTTCTITGWSDKEEDRIFPGISEYLKTELNCKHSAMTMEVNQACISFLVALQIASDYIKTGMYKNVLICSAETFTQIADFSLPSSTLFGDGAAAIVIGRSEKEGKLVSSHYKSIPTYNDIATLQWKTPTNKPGKEFIRPYFTLGEDAPTQMQTFVPQNVPEVVFKALEKADASLEDIHHFVFHQPSKMLIRMWAMGIGIKKEKYTTTVEKYSCLSSASIPMTLYFALKNGKIKPNNTIVLAGAGIGWGFGAQVWNTENINY
ncbi:3-oxoacyl-ACP synthase III family protein [Chryseobacterium lathyri]|uniref:3-oxoacyl-[acyl-carrier-protein] synthase-3 n=1 Tax=Chryseobacterium lathyri TaxID=395933 RepID=A0ABT9SMS5_9FLAO|nr:ketoacyl-ACP synthase III [Chryseobacterium lathyri]MDP9960568.1 3-oxoacyl-[acyl-carrier-protein] synthase-3 [Chryseobacterium lathyri]